MKTEETIEKTVLQQASEKLLKPQQEIDELAVQLALGRAEGKDEFELTKSEFRQQVKQLNDLLVKSSENTISPEVRAKIESLELQLALGKADSKEQFEEQKRKIVDALTALESKIKTQWQV
jgi:hypothetical protein